MARVKPWYSTKSNVYHNNTRCKTGNNIEKISLKKGKGNNRICEECKKLNQRK